MATAGAWKHFHGTRDCFMHHIGMAASGWRPVYDPRLVVLSGCDRDLCIPSCSVVSIPSSQRLLTEHTEDRQHDHYGECHCWNALYQMAAVSQPTSRKTHFRCGNHSMGWITQSLAFKLNCDVDYPDPNGIASSLISASVPKPESRGIVPAKSASCPGAKILILSWQHDSPFSTQVRP